MCDNYCKTVLRLKSAVSGFFPFGYFMFEKMGKFQYWSYCSILKDIISQWRFYSVYLHVVTTLFASIFKFHLCEHSKEWHCDAVRVIDVLFHTFNAVMAGTEYSVPKTGLLAVIVALSPPIAVMEIVVFNH